MEGEESPYKEHGNISFEEFLWAFNIVSSRHVTLHGHVADEDPNMLLLQMPFLDLLNHSCDPNVGVFPFYDKLEDKSYLVLRALRDIEPKEHLTVSYGALSNIHLLQKYGFTLPADSEAQNARNVVQGAYSFGDY